MKIAVIHQYYLRPNEPGGSRFNEFARMWTLQKHSVSIIAGQVSYLTGKRHELYRGTWCKKEKENGVTIFRTYTPDTYQSSFPGRMRAFFAFMISSCWAVIFYLEKPDIIIATSPTLLTVIPGILASIKFGCPFIFEMRDLWPEGAIEIGAIKKGTLLAESLYMLERWACARASAVVVLTPAFREDLLRRKLADDEKIFFIPNSADLDLFSPHDESQFRKSLGWEHQFVLIYTGAHGYTNRVDQLLDVAELLKSHLDIKIVTVGAGKKYDEIITEKKRRHLNNLELFGLVNKDMLPKYINACDVGIAMLGRNDIFKKVYPNKVFDYMACAKPIVIVIDGAARRLVTEEAGAGLFAEPERPADIAEKIMTLYGDRDLCRKLGKSGYEFVKGRMNRGKLSNDYLALFDTIVTNKNK